VSVAGIVGQATLDTTFAEACIFSLAVRVVGKETIAHVAFAAHHDTTQAACYHHVQTAYRLLVVGPDVGLVYEDVVVVTEDVAIVHQTAQVVGTCAVEVILSLVRAGSILAHSIGVDVMV